MNPWIFGGILAFVIFLVGLVVHAVDNKGRTRTEALVTAVFACIIIGAIFTSWAASLVNSVEHAAYRSGVTEGLEKGWYSAVPLSEMHVGGIYQYRACIEQELAVLRDPNGHIALFQVRCENSYGEESFLPKQFYQLNRGGRLVEVD